MSGVYGRDLCGRFMNLMEIYGFWLLCDFARITSDEMLDILLKAINNKASDYPLCA